MDLAYRHGHEVPSTNGDAIDPDRIVATVPGRDESDPSAAEAKALSEVDVVQVAVGSVLDLTSAEGVHGNPALLVRADDRASSPANRVNPDRRVVGCVPAVWDRLRLHRREDGLYSRLPDFSTLLGAPTQSCSPRAEEKGEPEGARSSRRPDSNRAYRPASVSNASYVPDEIRSAYLASVPAGRLGTREDIAHAVSFFASDAAAFATGQRLVVDGGRSLGE